MVYFKTELIFDAEGITSRYRNSHYTRTLTRWLAYVSTFHQCSCLSLRSQRDHSPDNVNFMLLNLISATIIISFFDCFLFSSVVYLSCFLLLSIHIKANRFSFNLYFVLFVLRYRQRDCLTEAKKRVYVNVTDHLQV